MDQLSSISEQLARIHSRVIAAIPEVNRIACALYDAESDELTTYVDSTLQGRPLKGYQFHLSDSASLSRIAQTGQTRYLPFLQESLDRDRRHSRWLLDENYQASVTVPMYKRGQFLGFTFYNSFLPEAFPASVREDLEAYAALIADAIVSSELPVRILERITRLRDSETADHLSRMGAYCRLIASELGRKRRLEDERVQDIYLLAPLHDIGKIAIPDAVLLKPDVLNEDERRVMQKHVEVGLSLVDDLNALCAFSPQRFECLSRIVGEHHERLDGSGYPLGLSGDEISMEGRITAVADVFDALISERIYKPAWSEDEAIQELQRLVEVGRLDGSCVDALLLNLPHTRAVRRLYRN
ncbi:HD-GYP domain-containing protein [Spiribacter insolitus]|uniref:HD domain-containing phosphohydrolase n=1 Tax=Spiribacter insolitus TaxID=3122417 RepID=A0ABV3T694_9GAMM